MSHIRSKFLKQKENYNPNYCPTTLDLQLKALKQIMKGKVDFKMRMVTTDVNVCSKHITEQPKVRLKIKPQKYISSKSGNTFKMLLVSQHSQEQSDLSNGLF